MTLFVGQRWVGWPVTVVAMACGLLLSVVAMSSAAGRPDVVAVIKARDRVLNRSPATGQLSKVDLARFATLKRAKAGQAPLRQTVGILTQTLRVVRASSATRQQRRGKADWLAGYAVQLRGLRLLERELSDVIAGHHAAARAAFHRGEALLGAGNKLADHGDRLLGLSTRY